MADRSLRVLAGLGTGTVRGEVLMTLTEFLLARIAEDEAAALASENYSPPWPGDWAAERVLAECEAKRRIVELHKAEVMGGVDDCGFACRNTRCPTLALLALPYSDHEDYNEAWRV